MPTEFYLVKKLQNFDLTKICASTVYVHIGFHPHVNIIQIVIKELFMIKELLIDFL